MRALITLSAAVATGPAAAQVEIVRPLVETAAREGGIAIVVLLIILGAGGWLFYIRERSRDAERERHDAALAATTTRFLGLVEKSGEVTKEIAVALDRLQTSLVEDRQDFTEMRGEMRAAISKSETTLTEIRAAVEETRDALRARSAGR